MCTLIKKTDNARQIEGRRCSENILYKPTEKGTNDQICCLTIYLKKYESTDPGFYDESVSFSILCKCILIHPFRDSEWNLLHWTKRRRVQENRRTSNNFCKKSSVERRHTISIIFHAHCPAIKTDFYVNFIHSVS